MLLSIPLRATRRRWQHRHRTDLPVKVVFQGGGAIGIAGAALFGRRHETVVVSRSVSSTPAEVPPRDAAYPRQVRSFGRGPVCRVPVVDWAAVSSESWDLLVLTTRPGDLDEGVAASIVATCPGIIAITSQVDGDRDIAVSLFPESEILVFSPALLSERTAGRSVSYWRPPGMPVFMASGPRETVRGLRRMLGGLIVGVPAILVSAPPAVFIPYVAQLSVREGNWADLRTHLRRPTQAAAEAVHAVTGVRMPLSARGAGLVLDALERFVPIDVGEYAGRHFARHEGQTLDMLDGWIRREAERVPATGRSQIPTPAVAQSSALRELAQILRLRVTRQPIP
ncbi:hypothetical protein BANT10_01818 [Brevibacterium antiquum]|uniref:Ketopantoate reductase N-terminal domain-containing protein n=1 Tax=Brevibacterium antiquum TaxID=234835 RepID=A0A2H1JAF1_9MICO|nr:hypothetical protein BANT10_01818 [Brevibacterium antiquum]